MEALAQKFKGIKNIRYVCRCDTCQEIFFETTYTRLPLVFPHLQIQPAKWYIQPGRHWIKRGKEHLIRVWLIKEAEDLREILFDISSKWIQDLVIYHPDWTDEILLRELDLMEKNI